MILVQMTPSTTKKTTAKNPRVLLFARVQQSTMLMANVPRAHLVPFVIASQNFPAAMVLGVLEMVWHINACLVNMV